MLCRIAALTAVALCLSAGAYAQMGGMPSSPSSPDGLGSGSANPVQGPFGGERLSGGADRREGTAPAIRDTTPLPRDPVLQQDPSRSPLRSGDGSPLPLRPPAAPAPGAK